MKPFLIGLLWAGWSLALAMGTPPRQPAEPVEKPAGAASVMLREDDLRATPDTSARVLRHLGKGLAVGVLANQGGWTRIAVNGQTGWVRVLSVRSAQTGQASADLAGLAEAGTSPRDPGKVVAVAGVRGLNEEILKSANFDATELQLLDSYALGRAEGEQFAQAVGLRPRSLPYFAAPVTRNGSGNDSPWMGNEP